LSTVVTSAKGQRWAIEHTNLGTIRLTDLGKEMTLVASPSHDLDDMEKQQREAL